ncbi:MAG: hypothetical protein PHZ19_10685 [Candidatus Thermoplasmatota archaeon]|jgi:GT2 family glycosyltransferase|nr:hypothetical protein [Candidatus Thermoplasmatota archaeon]
MKACAAFLNHSHPELASVMGRQLADVDLFAFDNGGGLYECPEGVKMVFARHDNANFSGGWNWAMGILGGMNYTHVWMLNDDVEDVAPWMLDELLAYMPKDAAAVTPPFNSPHPIFHPQPRDHVYARKVSWIDWCIPLVRMDAWKDVGGFDIRFRGYGADLDFCRRAREMDWGFYVVETAPVLHLGSVTGWPLGGNCVDEMNRLLKEKWGVEDWTKMV